MKLNGRLMKDNDHTIMKIFGRRVFVVRSKNMIIVKMILVDKKGNDHVVNEVSGIAKCHPNDEFDIVKGIHLAFYKMERAIAKKILVNVEKRVDRYTKMIVKISGMGNELDKEVNKLESRYDRRYHRLIA